MVGPQLVGLGVGMSSVNGVSRPSPGVRRGGFALRVWSFIVLLGALAAIVFHLGVHQHGAGVWANPLEWLVMAAAFAVAEACVVHVNVGRHAHTFALADLPLVAGLLLLAPVPLVAARLTGALFALVVVRRQPPMKLAFNLAQLSLGLAAALFVWTAIGSTDPAAQSTWLAALAGVLTVAVVSGAAVNIVMVLAGGQLQLGQAMRTLVAGVVTGAANTAFVLMSVAVVGLSWHGIWAVLLVAGFLTVAQRSHLRSEEHTS